MTTVSAFVAALAEEHRLAHAELRAAEEAGDEERRTQALGRLADLQDIASRSLDVVSLEAVTGQPA
ncbi:hypothetical protein [Intrasporangium sp.]|uniref:hypothetical protein n=1 Tax=Intrasporangium sp. TaxID=1925024 RepID=UPI00293A352B|nr:hypothetical protein [Intrasporangium sp.]MDV3223049.1 hypothetical protein [Intrasporangium sp.]